MSFSRMPESRGGGGSNLRLFGLVIIAVLVSAALVIYFTTGFGSNSSQAAPPESLRPSTTVWQGYPGGASLPVQPAVQQVPAPVSNAALTKMRGSNQQSLQAPAVNYGEILSEGFVTLDLPGNEVADAWYTRQLDTYTRNLTLFFAVYNSSSTIIRTVEVAPYIDGAPISNARIALFYPNGIERHVGFDGNNGTVTLTQRHGQPYGPSLFSPDLRVALVNYGLTLGDQNGSVRADIHLDRSGLSDTESLTLVQSNRPLVNQVLAEVQGIVDQINSRRPVQ